MSPPAPPDAAARGALLERNVRLSESRLWQWQRWFFEQRGPTAWTEGIVPWRITNAPPLAQSYVDLALALVRDRMARSEIDPSQPVYLVELGGGTGRLAWLMLRRLEALPRPNGLERVVLRYLWTDLPEKNVRACASHPLLAPYLQKGMLELATHDATSGAPPRLVSTGERVGPFCNPPIFIANYFFDSLPVDLYRARAGELEEGRITLHSQREHEPDLDDAAILERLAPPDVAFQPAERDRHPDFLRDYARALGDGSIIYPRGAIECFEALSRHAGGRWALLAADKGLFDADAVRGLGEPKLVFHGSFSLLVDFHLLASHWERSGATVLRGATGSTDLGTLAVVAGDPEAPLPDTRRAFAAATRFGPLDRHRLVDGLLSDGRTPTLEQGLALLRLSGFDPDVALRLAGPLREHAADATPTSRRELAEALALTWDNYFPLGEKADLAFELATVFQRLGGIRMAAELYGQSLSLFGPAFATWFNLALCLAELGELEAAHQAMERAAALEPSHARAVQLKDELAALCQRPSES